MADGSQPTVPLRAGSAVRVLVLVAVGLAILALVAKFHWRTHRIHVTVNFNEAAGLKPGAPVRLAGVAIGTVQSISIHPERKDLPVETQLLLQTKDRLEIPADSLVRLETAGVLGETFLDIDFRNAHGLPLRDHGSLKSEARPSVSEEFIESLKKWLQRSQPCSQEAQQEPNKK